MTDRQRDVGIFACVFVLLGLTFCVAFLDHSSHQSADECVQKMREPILAKVREFPSDLELTARSAEVEHVLYGNKSDAQRMAERFASKGWKAKAGPRDEIGWGAVVTEDAVRFRPQASQRIERLCAVAEHNNLQYESWRLNAPVIATYVSQ